MAGAVAGYGNVALGYQAMGQGNTTSAIGNTCLGRESGHDITTGDYNTIIGKSAGDAITTGYQNIVIGFGSDINAAGGSNQIVIGDQITGKGNVTGFISPAASNPGGIYQGNNSTAWTAASDRRIKKNITDSTIGLTEINQIQVRNFEYRLPEEIDEVPQSAAIAKEGIQTGVISQEIMDILPDVVTKEDTGVYAVDSDNITWHLVKAIQELSAEVEKLKNPH